MKIVVAVGVVSMVAGYLVFLWVRSSVADRRSLETTSIVEGVQEESVRGLRERRIEKEVANLRAQVLALSGEVAISHAERVVSHESPRPDIADHSPELAEQEEKQRREYIAGIESAFRVERSDAKWASAATTAVTQALRADDVNLVSRSIECRSQTCRVEIVGTGPHDINAVAPMFGMHLVSVLPSMAADRVQDANGNTVTILYLSQSDQNQLAKQ